MPTYEVPLDVIVNTSVYVEGDTAAEVAEKIDEWNEQGPIAVRNFLKEHGLGGALGDDAAHMQVGGTITEADL